MLPCYILIKGIRDTIIMVNALILLLTMGGILLAIMELIIIITITTTPIPGSLGVRPVWVVVDVETVMVPN